MTRRTVAALTGAVLVVIGAAFGFHRRHLAPVPAAADTTTAPAARTGSADERAPPGVRVRVEVLNGTNTRGLARRATMFLRDRGFDVLETGTETKPVDTTLVVDLTGHPDWARRVARALGVTRVESHADSSRYLDVSVILGATWRPPAQPFYP